MFLQRLKNMANNVRKTGGELALKSKSALLLSAVMFSTSALADVNNTVTLDTPDSSFLAKVVDWMQEVINVVGGAGVLFIVFIAAVIAIGLWILAPKDAGKALTWLMRICAGGIMIFNLALLFSWLQS